MLDALKELAVIGKRSRAFIMKEMIRFLVIDINLYINFIDTVAIDREATSIDNNMFALCSLIYLIYIKLNLIYQEVIIIDNNVLGIKEIEKRTKNVYIKKRRNKKIYNNTQQTPQTDIKKIKTDNIIKCSSEQENINFNSQTIIKTLKIINIKSPQRNISSSRIIINKRIEVKKTIKIHKKHNFDPQIFLKFHFDEQNEIKISNYEDYKISPKLNIVNERSLTIKRKVNIINTQTRISILSESGMLEFINNYSHNKCIEFKEIANPKTISKEDASKYFLILLKLASNGLIDIKSRQQKLIIFDRRH